MARNKLRPRVHLPVLNSLRLAGLQSPKHVDHPGTTVHLVGAVLLRLVHIALRTGEGLEDDVLAHPEFYLQMMSGSCVCIYAVLLYLCGALALDVLRSLPLAWLVEATRR